MLAETIWIVVGYSLSEGKEIYFVSDSYVVANKVCERLGKGHRVEEWVLNKLPD